MAKTAMIRARIEPDLKLQAESVIKKLGMTPTEAINLFYSQIKLRKGLPFDVKIPNKVTLKTFKDTDAGKNLIESKDVEDFFKKLEI